MLVFLTLGFPLLAIIYFISFPHERWGVGSFSSLPSPWHTHIFPSPQTSIYHNFVYISIQCFNYYDDVGWSELSQVLSYDYFSLNSYLCFPLIIALFLVSLYSVHIGSQPQILCSLVYISSQNVYKHWVVLSTSSSWRSGGTFRPSSTWTDCPLYYSSL